MRQQGIALITSLVFLLIITAISVVAAQRGGSNLRMVSNMQESAAAFQRAEEGIYQAVAEHETNNIFQAADVGTTNTVVDTTDIQITVRVDAMEGACAQCPMASVRHYPVRQFSCSLYQTGIGAKTVPEPK